jgi:hypothetical protein
VKLIPDFRKLFWVQHKKPLKVFDQIPLREMKEATNNGGNQMKHFISQNRYASGQRNRGSFNCEVNVSDDGKEITALSYGWWRFIATDAKGNVVVNNARYSSSTGQHQRNGIDIMRRLGIVPALTLTRTRKTLDNIKLAVLSEINCINEEIASNQKKIDTKGSRKAKNIERKADIIELNQRIAELKQYLETYHDKKKKPLSVGDLEDHRYQKKLFLNQDGTLNEKDFNEFASRVTWWHGSVSSLKGVENILELFGLKLNSKTKITTLVYGRVGKLEKSVKELNAEDRKIVKAWIVRNKLVEKGFSTVALDKLNTYLNDFKSKRSKRSQQKQSLKVVGQRSWASHRTPENNWGVTELPDNVTRIY